ncbi:hypothetical protein [Cystobacter ferrugineus]|uniref:Uncharacterized protein n=1 Tax=Cystobacter ferrugineus TaxID=83449 RepID=A0A1L9B5Z3_9BACT|nr:hypothetical protein [Cystobacter ferrugineus]OJH37672.1 hypothetical protein BON30_26120 [Cystobacter ferrugineus]
MIKKSFKATWQAQYQAERDDYLQLLNKDIFANWGTNSKPEWTAERQFMMGLNLFYSGLNDKDAQGFVAKGARMAERALQERRFESEQCKAGFPLNRGRLLRTQAYTSAILDGTFTFNSALLRQAAVDHHDWCRPYKGRQWDSQAQAYYLAAVRLSIIADDLQTARELLGAKKSFKWHEEEFQLWSQWVEARHAGGREWDGLDEYFCRVRDPNYVPDIFMEKGVLQLELGMIRYKYQRGTALPAGAWPTIFEMIAA